MKAEIFKNSEKLCHDFTVQIQKIDFTSILNVFSQRNILSLDIDCNFPKAVQKLVIDPSINVKLLKSLYDYDNFLQFKESGSLTCSHLHFISRRMANKKLVQ